MSNEDNYLVEGEIYHFYDQVMSNEYKLTQISKMSFLFSTDKNFPVIIKLSYKSAHKQGKRYIYIFNFASK